MIRKYLIYGKQLYLAQNRANLTSEADLIFELLLPTEHFVTLREMLREADYKMASGEDRTAMLAHYRKVMKFASRFAVLEKDRSWLIQHGTGQSGGSS